MLENLFETSQKRIDYQISSCDAIDQKIGILIGFASVIIAIVLSFDKDLGFLQWIFFKTGSVLIVISIVIMFFGYRKVVLNLGMSVDEIIKLIKGKSNDKIFLYTQITYNNEAFKKNRKILGFKNRCLGWGTVVLLIGVGVFVGSLFIQNGGIAMDDKKLEERNEEELTDIQVDPAKMEHLEKGAQLRKEKEKN